MTVLGEVLLETLTITALVLVMMVAVDALNVVSRGRVKELVQGNPWRQYAVAALLGVIPGCQGAFAAVSLYVHGMLSFGALVGCMIATSGDDAFVMLSKFPRAALVLFGLLFVLALGAAWVADRLLLLLRFRPSGDCSAEILHPGEGGLGHYFREHIWDHILRKHLWRVFLWTLVALAVVKIGLGQGNLDSFVTQHESWMLLLAAAVGIIPQSGPHLIFVALFAEGLVPFSVLLVSAFVQNGHGLLPLLSYSWRDSLVIKAFGLVFGLTAGTLLYVLGG